MTGFIRTIGGDLPVDLAGPVYAHEHLIIDAPVIAQSMPHIHLHSVEEARAEVQTCVAAGVRTMVDAMPAAAGRSAERLSRISIYSGIRIVAATGLHTEKYYEAVPWTRSETPDQLAERFIADIEVGMDINDYLGDEVDRSGFKAGVVKVASSRETMTDRDQRLIAAGALAARATGAPILTHTEGGLGGMAQIEALIGHGVAPNRIALSHTDKVDDDGYHRAMLETGVLLCYDQGIRDPETTFSLVERMSESGHSDQIVLGTDGARRSLWKTLGGEPGLASLYVEAARRFDAALVERLFVANPGRWLTLSGG